MKVLALTFRLDGRKSERRWWELVSNGQDGFFVQGDTFVLVVSGCRRQAL